MTPLDFSAIIGLRVCGKRLRYDIEIYNKPDILEKLAGKEIASYREVKVSYDHIYQSYKDMVYLYYIPSLEKVHEIANYNWGGAALVCCYCHMDAMSRAKLSSIGRFWQAWEVWACEYLPCMRISKPKKAGPKWPKANRWLDLDCSSRDTPHDLNGFRMKLWAWYLGEQVTVQSCDSNKMQVPKAPPHSMMPYISYSETDLQEEIHGWDALEFVVTYISYNYKAFRKKWLSYSYSSTSTAVPSGGAALGDITMSPWKLRVTVPQKLS
ncbi:hypothetical protein TIFTF001_038993 [Ficus carica]|uniref:Aminotransferase-like plant mobile domain-containing protein n=1 Tax=Ficus carica TaxID=3494 RepID=A0AA88JAJ0_FICCA|nr:hypothetical protein TIFTF001_038993 [Ficus carica]